MATRALPQEQKRLGINLGTVLFILLRIVLAYALMACAGVPGFGFAGAALAAVGGAGDGAFAARAKKRRNSAVSGARRGDGRGARLRRAGRAAQHGRRCRGRRRAHKPLVMFGLALSIPLLAFGSAQFINVLRKPPLLWASAGLLGWVAGRMATEDALLRASAMPPEIMHDFAPAVGALVAVLLAYGYSRGRKIKRVADEVKEGGNMRAFTMNVARRRARRRGCCWPERALGKASRPISKSRRRGAGRRPRARPSAAAI